jgi:peptidylprolyl isomerase
MKKTSLIAAALSLALAASLPLSAQEKAATKPAEKAPDTAAARPADKPADKKESKMVKTPSGLQYEDVKVGTGAEPKAGQTCSVHYTGWLWVNGAKGSKFDSSVDRGQPFQFAVGRGNVIRGWDEGVLTMKVGGKRNLIIHPGLGYGAQGTGGVIPPNATLFFEVELLGVK